MVSFAWRATLVATTTAGLLACAGAVDDPVLYAAGWRPAYVAARGASEALISADVGLCIGSHVWQPGEPAAAVRFRSDNRFRLRRVTIVVPTSGVEPVEGSSVWVDILGCRLQTEAPTSTGG